MIQLPGPGDTKACPGCNRLTGCTCGTDPVPFAKYEELAYRYDCLREKHGALQERVEELEEQLKIYRRCMDEIEYQAKQAARDTR